MRRQREFSAKKVVSIEPVNRSLEETPLLSKHVVSNQVQGSPYKASKKGVMKGRADRQIAKTSKELTKKRRVSEEEIRAFATRINELYNSLLAYSLYLTKNKVEAEDLLSESILKALKNYQSYDERDSLKSYMNTIIHNTFVNNYHKAQREIGYKNMLTATTEPLTTFSSEYESLQLLKNLDLTSRQVLYLADVMGYKYKEISDILAIPEGTVMSKLSRGRKRLREELKLNEA